MALLRFEIFLVATGQFLTNPRAKSDSVMEPPFYHIVALAGIDL